MSPDKLANFKRALEELIADVERREAPSAAKAFTGEVIDPPLEHTVRTVFLNRLLVALGWNLAANVAEEARIKGDTTLFLDYLGVHFETRIPLLILEAKAWEKPFVAASTAAGKRRPPEELLASALAYIKGGKEGSVPVIGEWIEWLSKLQQYVRDLKNQSHHAVTRVAISSGQWLVIFTDPTQAFLDSADVDPASILVFRIESFVRESDHIFGQISYSQLVTDIPSPLRATQVRAFISANTVRRVFRALWVSWKSSGSKGMLDTFPQIIVYPAVVLERADGHLVHVANSSRRSFIPADLSQLTGHIEEVERNSADLLSAVFTELERTLDASDVAEFPGFPVTPLRGSKISLVPELDAPTVRFLKPWPDSSGEFLLVTGASAHFLRAQPSVASCIGHDWVACQKIDSHFGLTPILSPSVDPKSFYISGTSHHCAHRTIQDRRAGRCHLAVFETFLCCKTCIFNHSCWPTETTASLPCGSSADRGAEPIDAVPA